MRRALAIGFTLDKLVGLLSERDSGRAPCRRVRALVAERLAELELRDELRVLLREWDRRLARIPVGTQARLLDVLADRPVVDRAVARPRLAVGTANLRPRPLPSLGVIAGQTLFGEALTVDVTEQIKPGSE